MKTEGKHLLFFCYFAYSTRILRDAAEVLGNYDDVQEYSALLDRIIDQFNYEFVSRSGRLVSPTQTGQVLALMLDLVDGKVKERTAFELIELIIQNNYHLTTGFVGTPYLCLALTKGGYHETAVKLLMQEDYPSWLYSVKKGVTTIWGHWDGIKEDGSFWSDEMNSFNHYAYGAIGNWMYRVLAGLDMNEAIPAYKKIRFEPKFAGIQLTYAKAAYESMYGRILSSWRITDEEIEIEVEIPANTTGEIILPYAHINDVLESGKSLESTAGVYSCTETNDSVILMVGSGPIALNI